MPARFRFSSGGTFLRRSPTRGRQSSLKAFNCIALACLLLGMGGCSRRPNVFEESRDVRLIRLGEERARLAGAGDPVERTRIQIRISDLMISFMGDAVTDGDTERLETHMAEYREAVLDARDTMMSSGRDASRDVAGYRDLEIALRQQIRQLDDIGVGLTLAFREPIQVLIAEMTEIRNDLLDTLFPESDPV